MNLNERGIATIDEANRPPRRKIVNNFSLVRSVCYSRGDSLRIGARQVFMWLQLRYANSVQLPCDIFVTDSSDLLWIESLTVEQCEINRSLYDQPYNANDWSTHKASI